MTGTSGNSGTFSGSQWSSLSLKGYRDRELHFLFGAELLGTRLTTEEGK